MLNLFRYFAIKRESRISVADFRAQLPTAQQTEHPAESIIIPVVGLDYVEEGLLAAEFARLHCPNAKEIRIVSELDETHFTPRHTDIQISTLQVDHQLPEQHKYLQIYKSRLIKLQAPLQAKFNRILLIDSDMMMLQEPVFPWSPNHMIGSFRMGKMFEKFKRSGSKIKPEAMRNSHRVKFPYHLNGAFLASDRETWHKLSPLWLEYFLQTWSVLDDRQPPTDQLPLCCALDTLRLSCVELPATINWPVSKKIGGKPSAVPTDIIAAHGGFPISEWQKYLLDKQAPLHFVDANQTRKIRYLTDQEKQTAPDSTSV